MPTIKLPSGLERRAPAIYRPNMVRSTAPPIYRPATAPVQTKTSTSLSVPGSRSSLPPPVYRPQSQGISAKTSSAQMKSSTVKAVPPPVYRPLPTKIQAKSNAVERPKLIGPAVYRPKTQTANLHPIQLQTNVPPSLGAIPPLSTPGRSIVFSSRPAPLSTSSASKVLQLSKQEKQKKLAKEAEQRRESKAARNQTRINQYQTPLKDQEKQKRRENAAATLGRQGVNIAHGFGGQGSGVSSKGKGIINSINNAASSSNAPAEVEKVPAYYKRTTASTSEKPSNKIPPEEYKQGRAKAANCAKASSGGGSAAAKQAYISYCKRAFAKYNVPDERIESWADAWIAEQEKQEEQSVAPLDEHPSDPPFQRKEDSDEDDDDNGGRTSNSFGIGNNTNLQTVLVS